MKLTCSRLPIIVIFVFLLIIVSSAQQLSAQNKSDNSQTNDTKIIAESKTNQIDDSIKIAEPAIQIEDNSQTRSRYLTNIPENEHGEITSEITDDFANAINAYNDQDYIKAYELFDALAEKGHIDALNNLGTMYQTGQGTPRDYVKAAESYRIAASEGHIDAAINLSTLYRLGIGVQKDLAEAYAWSIVAARHGDSEATTSRDLIKALLKPEEIESSDIAAKSYLDYLATNELPLAWLVPQHLKLQKIPDEYKKYLTEQITTIPNTKDSSIKPKQTFAALPDVVVPPGFTAIIPKSTQPDSQSTTTTIPDDVNIPKGFSAIIPRTNSTPEASHAHSNNPAKSEQFKIITPENTNSTVTEFNNDSILHMAKMSPPPAIAGQQIFIKPNILNESQMTLENLTSSQIAEKQKDPKRYSTLITPTIMPATMSTSGETYFRPTTLPSHIKNAVIIRPRRVIPVKVTPIFTVEISQQLMPFIRSLSNAHNVSDEQVVAALKIANPNYFEKNPPLRAINDQEQMTIPPKADILKAPLSAAGFEENIQNSESNNFNNATQNNKK